MKTESRITKELLDGTSSQDFIMPAETRQMIIRFFNLPDVIAPSAAVLQIISVLGALKPLSTEKANANGTEPGS